MVFMYSWSCSENFRYGTTKSMSFTLFWGCLLSKLSKLEAKPGAPSWANWGALWQSWSLTVSPSTLISIPFPPECSLRLTYRVFWHRALSCLSSCYSFGWIRSFGKVKMCPCAHPDAFFSGLYGVLKMVMGSSFYFKGRAKENLAWNMEITFLLEKLQQAVILSSICSQFVFSFWRQLLWRAKICSNFTSLLFSGSPMKASLCCQRIPRQVLNGHMCSGELH